MKVSVNNREITIFNGAKVKDAVRAYFTIENQAVPDPFPVVRDSYGNRVGGDGSLLEGSSLVVEGVVEQKRSSFLCRLLRLLKISPSNRHV
ncbi:MAG: hypothetical protein CSA01_00170 [Bacteroidetes bacterium]|nr:MAG: hypothetical protein CSA01_00170 [Bacteroidota bacterium]